MKNTTLSNTLQRGFSLVELMIALAIGVTLIGGALVVFASTRGAFQTNENITLMQENARYAFTMLEPDIQLAGFYGKHNEAAFIRGSAIDRGPLDPIGINNDCGVNFVVQFDLPVAGSNDVAPTWTCLPAGRYLDGTDAVAVRRVDTLPIVTADLAGGTLYLRSSEAPLGEVFEGTAQPAGMPATAENFEVRARAYYVSGYTVATTDEEDGIPSLRRVELISQGTPAVPTMVDREVVPGVENMQIQYGIDLNANVDGRKAINAYVTADNPLLNQPGTAVRAVRIWLLMRAEKEEAGYVDQQSYQLGDITVDPITDGYRRLVVSRTIFLRNQHE